MSESRIKVFLEFIENPNTPSMTLKPVCPILTLEYNSKDSNILVSGLTTGQVACWDIRKGSIRDG